MRATLIHCPAGGSATDEAFAFAERQLSRHFELDAQHASKLGKTATELAHAAVAAGSKLLIASGGDGTVSSVASAAVGRPDVRVGILPQGTANSIAGHLGIPDDLEGACEVVVHGRERLIDTALVNDRPMILMATLGVHADAVTEAPRERKRRYGALAYVIEEAKKLAGDSRFEVVLEAAGERVVVQVSAITVANLAPPTTLFAQGPGTLPDDDGLLDVTLVSIDGIADALATSLHLATHALRGVPSERENIGYFRAQSVRIAARDPRRVMVDGEDVGEGAVTVTCIPRSLRVRVPQET